MAAESGNVEDMLLSMLDERDRLMVGLKEAREELQTTQIRLRDVEKERDSLQNQLSSTIPSVSPASSFVLICLLTFHVASICLLFIHV